MNRRGLSGVVEKFRVILPVILRVTFCLVMWTLGVMTMSIAEAETREHRVAHDGLAIYSRGENLQSPGDAAHELRRRNRGEKISHGSNDRGPRQ
ncbi:MAG TPA: hypothetical protein VFI38_09730 [Candidatus Acidoferrum sp.]|nr:hypothetical protein [Candidatus Acidoferrum sp.]